MHAADRPRSQPEAPKLPLWLPHPSSCPRRPERQEQTKSVSGQQDGHHQTLTFATLDRLLKRLHANKAELLRVLDHPEIPLHTNGSENDIRCQVTKRAVSGGTRSDTGRDCRDAFLGLAKTCRKLGVAFWDYLGARIGVADAPAVAPLADLIRCRGQPA
jgi:hypothetical protein